jgi:hypothetical protein
MKSIDENQAYPFYTTSAVLSQKKRSGDAIVKVATHGLLGVFFLVLSLQNIAKLQVIHLDSEFGGFVILGMFALGMIVVGIVSFVTYLRERDPAVFSLMDSSEGLDLLARANNLIELQKMVDAMVLGTRTREQLCGDPAHWMLLHKNMNNVRECVGFPPLESHPYDSWDIHAQKRHDLFEARTLDSLRQKLHEEQGAFLEAAGKKNPWGKTLAQLNEPQPASA